MKEVQNQPQISMKQVEEEDRISELPDSLLVEILSRVGLVCTKYVVITSALSKRWQYLWTFLPYLIFHEGPSDFYYYVGKTLTQCSRELKLNKFGVHMENPIRCELLVNEWIEYAIDRNVEHLSISCKSEFQPNQSFYIHSCFTSIVLKNCILNYTGPIGWKNLKRLYFEETKVDEDLIENILSGSPLLETFHLNDCYGYKRLNITSKSVKHLLVSGFWYRPYEGPFCDSVEINAPYILSLTIGESWTSRKVLLLDVSSLVNAYFHYSVVTEEMIKELDKLRHAKEIKIWNTCLGVSGYLEEKKDFVYPQIRTTMDQIWIG